MTSLTIPYRFQIRGGMAADLAADNDTPLDRELVVERDTGKGKIGDGVTPYNDLEYTPVAAPVELRKTVTDLEWRAVGGSAWQQLLPLSEIAGPSGSSGREVELRNGTTHIQWRYVGDATWEDLIARSLIKGDTGEDGKQVEIQTNATHVQWRYVGDASWINLILLSAITGPAGAQGDDGRSPEFRFSATHLQYRLIGNITWLDLYPIASLVGPQGADGADGIDAPSITRTDINFSSPLGLTVSGTLPCFKMMRLFRCAGDNPYRLRLYSTVAERDADFSRPRGQDAALGSGLLFEFIGVVGLLGANLSPVPVVYNNEVIPVSQIAYILEADSGLATTVTMSVMEIQP